MKISRREAFQLGALSTLTVLAAKGLPKSTLAPKELKIGFVTDVHYADASPSGTRFYKESLGKLNEAAAAWKKGGVDVIVENGDLIDSATKNTSRDLEMGFLKEIDKVLKSVKKPVHYVFGNHCLVSMSKADFLATVGQKEPHHSTDKNGWHLVFLDACYRADEVPYENGNYKWSDTEVPAAQREWLKADLAKTKLPTLVFVHQRMDQEPGNPQRVKSAEAVQEILTASGKVKAVIMGHSHTNEIKRISGVDYITLGAMVEGSGAENNAYSILHLSGEGEIKLEAFRHHLEHPLVKK